MVEMIDSEVTLVSVHIPKTGGMTHLSILQQVYVGHLQLAYEDERDTIVEKPLCYHGHAVLDKFANNLAALPNVKWMTFLRDPLRSAVSLYHYGVKHGTIREMGLDQWLTGTEMFCWPDPPAYNHNRFSKWIGRARTSWDQFDLIGLTEYFDESIQLASEVLGWPDVEYTSQNVGTYGDPNMNESTINVFRRLNSDDYIVYDKAIRRLQGQ